jgi:hypothetical protein
MLYTVIANRIVASTLGFTGVSLSKYMSDIRYLTDLHIYIHGDIYVGIVIYEEDEVGNKKWFSLIPRIVMGVAFLFLLRQGENADDINTSNHKKKTC